LVLAIAVKGAAMDCQVDGRQYYLCGA